MRTRSATCLQTFVHQKRLSFCFTSYYSWIIKLLMLITTNPLDKTNETFNIYCTLYFHTVVLLSCSLHSYIHLFKFLFMFELTASIFWTKINRIYKREFSCVSNQASPILDPRTSTEKTLTSLFKSIMIYANAKICKDFLKHLSLF